MTKHAWLNAWEAGTGLCANAKRIDIRTQEMVDGRFVGLVYVAGPGEVCGHCRRALDALRDDIGVFLGNLERGA